jgi:hypothetical protein
MRSAIRASLAGVFLVSLLAPALAHQRSSRGNTQETVATGNTSGRPDVDQTPRGDPVPGLDVALELNVAPGGQRVVTVSVDPRRLVGGGSHAFTRARAFRCPRASFRRPPDLGIE